MIFRLIRWVFAFVDTTLGLVLVALVVLSFTFMTEVWETQGFVKWMTVAVYLSLLVAPWREEIHDWADRHIRGEAVMFYDDLLVAWAKAVNEYNMPLPQGKLSRSKLRRDQADAAGNLLLMRARLEQLYNSLHLDPDVPAEHEGHLLHKVLACKKPLEERERPPLRSVSGGMAN